ncbi:MAG: hypothetical protein EBU84_21510, partial [Actinobacteria bacterium]|nr:hypothetical protein [Actinomycetota bacterium]
GVGDTAVADPIATGTGTLTKSGSGTLTLSGANTYTGGTTISASGGGITISGAGSLASGSYSGAISLGASTTFTYASSSNQTLSGVISGAGAVTKNVGTSTLTLAGSNTYTGLTTVSTGVVAISTNTSLGDNGSSRSSTSVANGAAIGVSGGLTGITEPISISGTGISGNGVIRNTSGSNTWSGSVTLAATSEIQSDAGTLAFDVTSGSAISGSFSLAFDGAGNTSVADPIATGTGSLSKDGAGTLTLSASNTYSGTTTISNGEISISSDSNLGSAPNSFLATSITLDGGMLSATNSLSLSTNRGITLGPTNAGRINVGSGLTLTYGGVIAGSTNLTVSGSGTLSLSGANTYTGLTTVSSGSTVVVSANAS